MPILNNSQSTQFPIYSCKVLVCCIANLYFLPTIQVFMFLHSQTILLNCLSERLLGAEKRITKLSTFA